MGKYGSTAIRTATLLAAGAESAEGAWSEVAAKVFPDAPEARKKTCPREAFLGLCQEGLLVGVPHTVCRREDGRRNRLYSVTAANLLATDAELAVKGKRELWRRVLEHTGSDPNKRANEQMDVVLSLWDAGMIRGKG